MRSQQLVAVLRDFVTTLATSPSCPLSQFVPSFSIGKAGGGGGPEPSPGKGGAGHVRSRVEKGKHPPRKQGYLAAYR
jgi:hypothetical protein